MPALTPQQSNWENNIYVVATTRVFIMAGVVYLGRSLYYLISRYSGVVADTAPTAHASQARIGVDLINVASDTLNMVSMDPDVDININSDLELGIPQPRRSYQSYHYPYRPRAYGPQHLEASTSPESPTATAEQRTNVCNQPVNIGAENMRSIDMSGGL